MLLVFDPTIGVQYKDGRDLLAITRESDPEAWSLAVARNALWQIRGQWIYDTTRGIDYLRIMGEVPDVRFVEESMRRALQAYFVVLSLTCKRTGDDLIVTFVAKIDRTIVTQSLSFAEAVEAPPEIIAPIGYKMSSTWLAVHFSATLDPWQVPAPEDFKFLGFDAAPTITSVTVNGTHVILALTGEFIPQAGTEFFLSYDPGEEPLRSVARVPVPAFVLPLADLILPPGYILLDAFGHVLIDADGHILTT